MGVTMFAIGLGNALVHYRADFLRDLSDHGRGSFCYKATLARLSRSYKIQLAGAQAVVMPSASLSLELIQEISYWQQHVLCRRMFLWMSHLPKAAGL